MKNNHRILTVMLAVLTAAINHTHAATTDSFSGKRIVLDDRYFSGCFHNAFEGIVESTADGGVKRGRQGIQRTKGVICGSGTKFATMTASFQLSNPELDAAVILRGLDDHFTDKNPLTVRVNGRTVADAVLFPDNDTSVTKNARYFIGWADQKIAIPKGVLKAGENRLEIHNPRNVFDSTHWNHAVIDTVSFEFSGEQTMTVNTPPMPLYYYGLDKGIELSLWPTRNLDELCLIKDGELQITFGGTMPNDGQYEGKEKGRTKELSLIVVSHGDFTIFDNDGKPFVKRDLGNGLTEHKHVGKFRIVYGPTPHPAQGIGAFIRAHKAWEGGTFKAWFQLDGVDYQKIEYPIRAVELSKADRAETDFSIAMWGGGTPKEPSRMQDYVDMLKRAGFDRVYTGDSKELNRQLKEEGFEVVPRFGWFGHHFKVEGENAKYAAINAKGQAMKKDFCPLEILAHEDDKEIGKFFRRARHHAELPDIDGICVDYECAPVWCWGDACLAEFTKETGISATREELSGNGEHADAYRDFGRRLNRRLLTRVREIMKASNPNLRYVSLASVSDLPTYWWDGRARGRHAARELVKFADEIAISAYFYELPGGLKSVPAMVDMTRAYAVDEGRDVRVSLIVPVATTISETPRFRQLAMGPKAIRQLVVLSKACGGKGLSFFRGDCFDGAHFLAIHQGMNELAKLRPYLKPGMDRSSELVLRTEPIANRQTDLAATQNILSRLEWQPSEAYEYHGVQLLTDTRGEDRVLLLFNFANHERRFQVGTLGVFDASMTATDFATGEALGEYTRTQIQAGQLDVLVAPQDVRMIRLVSNKKQN